MPPEDPAITRAAEAAALGHRPHLTDQDIAALTTATREDPDPRVRAAALAALVRAAPTQALETWHTALTDPAPEVRRRAADLARHLPEAPTTALIPLLEDPDVTVVVAAAEALGEAADRAVEAGAVEALATTTTDHEDALAREAAAAALGALADQRGLPAILTACNDKPTVRRRAVLALAPFEGKAVDEALAKAREDKDWQVRQAAEDLTD